MASVCSVRTETKTLVGVICAICLGPVRKPTKPGSCIHYFCKKCLLEWSKVKNECPLCKTKFRMLFRHYSHLLEKEVSIPGGARLMEDDFFIVTAYTQLLNFHGSFIRFRRSIYLKGLRAFINIHTVHFPDIFRAQPLQVSRLRPWLEREMHALIPSRWIQASAAITEVLHNHSLDNPFVFATIFDFLGDLTLHFRHELRLFAASYYDIYGWDRNAQYLAKRTDYHQSEVAEIPIRGDVEEIRQPRHLPNPRRNLPIELITVSDDERDPEITEVVNLTSEDDEVQAIPTLINLIEPTSSSSTEDSSRQQRPNTRSRRVKKIKKESSSHGNKSVSSTRRKRPSVKKKPRTPPYRNYRHRYDTSDSSNSPPPSYYSCVPKKLVK